MADTLRSKKINHIKELSMVFRLQRDRGRIDSRMAHSESFLMKSETYVSQTVFGNGAFDSRG